MLLLRRPGRFPKSVPDYIKDNTWANTWGDVAVYIMMILGLLTTWLFQGIDHLFVGFLFLQAVPEVQRHFWFRPTVLLAWRNEAPIHRRCDLAFFQAHMIFVAIVMAFSLPYVSIGLTAWYFPSVTTLSPNCGALPLTRCLTLWQYLEMFPSSYLKWLIWIANAAPNLTDYYLILGLEKGELTVDLKRVFCPLSVPGCALSGASPADVSEPL